MRRHLLPRPPVQDRHLCAQPERRARGVHRDVATAHHDGPPADGRGLAQVPRAQEAVARDHPLQLLAPDLQPLLGVGAGRQKEGPVPLLQEAVERDVPAHGAPRAELDAGAADVVDLRVQHVAGQPVRRDARAEHAAQLPPRLEDGRPVSPDGQVVGGRQAAGPGADHGDLLPGVPLRLRGLEAHLRLQVGQKPLDRLDGDRLVPFSAAALRLAGVVADAPADGRQGVVPLDQLERLLELPGCRERDVTLDGDVRRALDLAGRHAPLVDGEGVGNRLGEPLEDRLALRQPLVELVGQLHGAVGGALPAPRAAGRVHVLGPRVQVQAEPARLAVDRRDLRVGQQLDVRVPAHLHELGGDDAHRAVVGREGLVQLRHPPADGRGLLHEEDLEPRVGQVQRGLHPADPRTHDRDRADWAPAVSCGPLRRAHASPRSRRTGRGSTRCLSSQPATSRIPSARPISSVTKKTGIW